MGIQMQMSHALFQAQQRKNMLVKQREREVDRAVRAAYPDVYGRLVAMRFDLKHRTPRHCLIIAAWREQHAR